MTRALLRQLAALAAAAAVAGACGGPPRPADRGRGTVRVAAAADLNVALAEIITRFAASHAVDVSASYGSSGTFFAQLMNGAPFDLYLSADVEYPRRLAERGLAQKDGVFTYAIGRIVVWTPFASRVDVQRGGLRALTESAARRIAIANPDHAPYGRAAVAALQSAGVYETVKPKLVYGENVAQAMQFAQSGAADAGIVALSLALAPNAKEDGRWVEIPPSEYPPIAQGGVVMQAAIDGAAAQAFRDYLTGSDGRAILQQYGFAPPRR